MPTQPSQNVSKVHSALTAALNDAERSLKRARELLSQIEKESAQAGPSFKDIPGIEGVFDGIYMVTKDGKKFEVPSNYAAKSLLVVGDGLKMIDREGRNFFKQISKVKRKLEEGIMVKKDGKWHAITPTGSYRIVDSVIEYNKVSLNDKVLVQSPVDIPTAEFAALEKVLPVKPVEAVKVQSTVQPAPVEVAKPVKTVVKPVVKPAQILAKEPAKADVKPAPKPPVKPITPAVTSLDDDDLR